MHNPQNVDFVLNDGVPYLDQVAIPRAVSNWEDDTGEVFDGYLEPIEKQGRVYYGSIDDHQMQSGGLPIRLLFRTKAPRELAKWFRK